MKNQERKVTVYSSSEFLGHINKYEGRLKDYGARPYAQYNSAPYVSFIPKRKRNAVVIQKTYQPYLIVLDGVGHPDPEAGFEQISEMWEKSKYSLGDDTGRLNFDQLLDKYLESGSATVLLDARHSKGYSTMKKVAKVSQ